MRGEKTLAIWVCKPLEAKEESANIEEPLLSEKAPRIDVSETLAKLKVKQIRFSEIFEAYLRPSIKPGDSKTQ